MQAFVHFIYKNLQRAKKINNQNHLKIIKCSDFLEFFKGLFLLGRRTFSPKSAKFSEIITALHSNFGRI